VNNDEVWYFTPMHGGAEATLRVALADVLILGDAPFMVLPAHVAQRFTDAMASTPGPAMRELLIEAAQSPAFVQHGVPAWHIVVQSWVGPQPWPVLVIVCGEVVCEFHPRRAAVAGSLSTIAAIDAEAGLGGRGADVWAELKAAAADRSFRLPPAGEYPPRCAYCERPATVRYSHPKATEPVVTCRDRLCFQKGWAQVYGMVAMSMPVTANGYEFPHIECDPI